MTTLILLGALGRPRLPADDAFRVVAVARSSRSSEVVRFLDRAGAAFDWSRQGRTVTVFGIGDAKARTLRRMLSSRFAGARWIEYPRLVPTPTDGPMIPFDLRFLKRPRRGPRVVFARFPQTYLPPVIGFLYRRGFVPGGDGDLGTVGLFDAPRRAKRAQATLKARYGSKSWLRYVWERIE